MIEGMRGIFYMYTSNTLVTECIHARLEESVRVNSRWLVCEMCNSLAEAERRTATGGGILCRSSAVPEMILMWWI